MTTTSARDIVEDRRNGGIGAPSENPMDGPF
jgi:hypothetical protein